MKKLLILIIFYSLIGQTETYEEYTNRINEITHLIQPGENLDQILKDRGYEHLEGAWGARKQTLLKNGLNQGTELRPGTQLVLPYSPGEQESFKQRSLAQDKSYQIEEPLNIDIPENKTVPLAKPEVEIVEPEAPIEEMQPVKEVAPKKIVKTKIIKKEIIKEKIIYINKDQEQYESWSHLRLFLGQKFTKISLDDPASGSAVLDSQYHFELGARWTQKWNEELSLFTQLDVDIISFDKPPGVSFNKSRFFLPGMEFGVQYATGKERLSFSFRYKSESQALTKVNSILAMTSLETSSFVFGFEKVLEGKRNYQFVGEAKVGYLFPSGNNGVEIEDGFNIQVGGALRYRKPDYSYELKPYFNWSQKKTSLTDESRTSFGVQFGYGKDF